MSFHHEKLIVYRRALEFAAWSQILIDSLTKKTSTRDHLERAGDSIALNIAEVMASFRRKTARDFSKWRMARPWNVRRVWICLWRGVAAKKMPLQRGN